ncbi:TetR/AcrR family transcriptional regulator [Metapseudomonas resinovorans]|uniref:Putative TetR family transcriptional regulator n=1 Tax=Metapseudomonas resinovorans NBRC 106553 TaxID=1245471 RepID=S6AZE3_METRE|nr:TetR/AcrR family transcriptional regulator [Pseudomonas resinovorans]BAN50296.1 putative TetR family transcriptional regulator [Pseudomonas resinovorans NBRC 106553]
MSDNSFPTSGPGRPKDLAKRKAILEAAKNLFLSKGYDGCSMDAIATEAGVSKLTVYSHFTDKETLFCAAVKAKCEEQMPELLFELPAGASIESVLLNVGENFQRLINSQESLELHRVMVATASQDPKLARLFYEAGPLQLLQEMTGLLTQANQAGKLRIEVPVNAAEHFFCLIKGGHNFRMLIGCCTPQDDQENEQHVREVVELFIRAYAP